MRSRDVFYGHMEREEEIALKNIKETEKEAKKPQNKGVEPHHNVFF